MGSFFSVMRLKFKLTKSIYDYTIDKKYFWKILININPYVIIFLLFFQNRPSAAASNSTRSSPRSFFLISRASSFSTSES
ncbi:Protein of unknown function [Cotesia congregata]|uniref:Uncharacterized protein n=1 Tax=Cotesia congregata TaxID=51543 RepID=A0A8J2MEF7_COTCN|nr:Protein of unknown function [Cotesia congregata]